MKHANTTLQAITSGKFATIQWIKNDGTVRTVSARFGVKKYIKTNKPAKHDNEKYVLVWCREAGGKRFNQPRLVRRDSILAIRAEGFDVKSNINSSYAKTIKA